MTYFTFKLILFGSIILSVILGLLRRRFIFKQFYVWLPVLIMLIIFAGYWCNWMWQVEHAGDIFNKRFPP